jgi:hypothetical protein
MGFLDGLLGGGKSKTTQVNLTVLESWLSKELDEESMGVIGQANEILRSINGIGGNILEDIKILQAAGANEVHPRYDKIVKTARPAYVKSMLLALENLEFKGKSLKDIRDYNSRLGSTLDSIGRMGFGDGKFLMLAFQDEMKRIQGGCRKLLNKKEELDKVLSSNAKLKALNDASIRYSAFIEVNRRMELTRTDILRLRREERESEKRLDELGTELEKLRESEGYVKIGEIKTLLAHAEDEVKALESSVHNALGPLKSALRKYGKTAFDLKRGKLAISIEEDSVGAFFNSSPEDVQALLGGLEESIQKGSISIKDNNKVIRRIASAREQLTLEPQTKRNELISEVSRLRHDMNALSGASEEDKIQNEMHSLKQTIEKAKADLSEAETRQEGFTKEYDESMQSLKSSMLELEVELVQTKAS